MFWITGGAALLAVIGEHSTNPLVARAVAQTQHVAWHGFTLWDLVFPLFLFLAGTSLPLSMAKRSAAGASRRGLHLHVIRRGLTLVFLGMAVVLATLTCARDLTLVARFLIAPSYDARAIQRQLEVVIGPDASVAGEWAPFLTLGTGIRSLYVTEVEQVEALRPDYLLLSETNADRATRRELARIPGVILGEPLLVARYTGSEVSLHSMSYQTPTRREARP